MALTKNQKKLARRKLGLLMGQKDWMDNPDAVAEVEKLGSLLGEDRLGFSKPLPPIDFEKLTPNNYLYLRQLGYYGKDIAKACGISKRDFDLWIDEQKVSRNHFTLEEIARMIFTENQKKDSI